MQKVICFGTFDVLHLGHLNYFQQAKEYGDYLIVVVARDKTKQDMNKKTHFNERERLKMVSDLKIVDEAVLGYEDNFFKIIKEKNPDIVCLGYDHKISVKELHNELLRLGLDVQIVRAKAYQAKKYKSSLIKGI